MNVKGVKGFYQTAITPNVNASTQIQNSQRDTEPQDSYVQADGDRSEAQNYGFTISTNPKFRKIFVLEGNGTPLLLLPAASFAYNDPGEAIRIGSSVGSHLRILGKTPDLVATIGWDELGHYIKDESGMIMVREDVERRSISDSIFKMMKREGFAAGMKQIFSRVSKRISDSTPGSIVKRLLDFVLFGNKAVKRLAGDTFQGIDDGWREIPLDPQGESIIRLRTGDAVRIVNDGRVILDLELKVVDPQENRAAWNHAAITSPIMAPNISNIDVLENTHLVDTNSQQSILLRPDEDGVVTIGRGMENVIKLFHPTVSRSHARIFQEGDSILIEDLSGKSTTTVNGISIERKTKVSNGDKIGFGNRFYSIRIPARTMLMPAVSDGQTVSFAAQETKVVDQSAGLRLAKLSTQLDEMNPRWLQQVSERLGLIHTYNTLKLDEEGKVVFALNHMAPRSDFPPAKPYFMLVGKERVLFGENDNDICRIVYSFHRWDRIIWPDFSRSLQVSYKNEKLFVEMEREGVVMKIAGDVAQVGDEYSMKAGDGLSINDEAFIFIPIAWSGWSFPKTRLP